MRSLTEEEKLDICKSIDVLKKTIMEAEKVKFDFEAHEAQPGVSNFCIEVQTFNSPITFKDEFMGIPCNIDLYIGERKEWSLNIKATTENIKRIHEKCISYRNSSIFFKSKRKRYSGVVFKNHFNCVRNELQLYGTGVLFTEWMRETK